VLAGVPDWPADSIAIVEGISREGAWLHLVQDGRPALRFFHMPWHLLKPWRPEFIFAAMVQGFHAPYTVGGMLRIAPQSNRGAA
jgi:hypothetical protein